MVSRAAAERQSPTGNVRGRQDTVLRAIAILRTDGVVFTVAKRGAYVSRRSDSGYAGVVTLRMPHLGFGSGAAPLLGRGSSHRTIQPVPQRVHSASPPHAVMVGTISDQPTSPWTAGRRCGRGSPLDNAYCSVWQRGHVTRGIATRVKVPVSRAVLTNCWRL